MLKEISEDLNSIRKIQSETKDTLSEIKNNYRETTVEWMTPRIKSMTWNIRNQKITNQNNKKKEPKKLRIVYAVSGTTSRGPTFASMRHQKEKRESKKLEIYLKQ